MEYDSDDSDPYFIEGNGLYADPYLDLVHGMPKEE